MVVRRDLSLIESIRNEGSSHADAMDRVCISLWLVWARKLSSEDVVVIQASPDSALSESLNVHMININQRNRT